jgi:hypothetical protein
MKKLLLAFLIFCGSCKSTESINRFANSATAGTDEISRSVLSFNRICRLYDPVSLARYTDTSLYGGSPVQPVIHCAEYRSADNLTGLISSTLLNYFSMLQSVSDKKLLAYNAQNLVNALAGIQPQVLPGLSLTEEKISAVGGLLNSILNEPLKYYRYKKLTRTIQQNDTALHQVIAAYRFILDSALSGEISQAKENYTSFVYAPLFTHSHTTVEKVMVNRQYTQFVQSLDLELEKIHKADILLVTIDKDHHLLAIGKTTDNFSGTEALIAQDILKINKLIGELTQLIK